MRSFLLPIAALGLALTAAVPVAAASHVSLAVGVRSNGVAVETVRYQNNGWRQNHRWLDRDDVQRHIYRAGYVRVYDLDRYGDRYRARAVNRRGVVFALTVDGYTGGIIRADIVGRERYRRW